MGRRTHHEEPVSEEVQSDVETLNDLQAEERKLMARLAEIHAAYVQLNEKLAQADPTTT